MATYKGIRGIPIRTIDGDASPVALGDIWYNSSAKAIRVGKTQAAAWASGGAMNTARRNVGSAGATQSAAMVAAGTPHKQV